MSPEPSSASRPPRAGSGTTVPASTGGERRIGLGLLALAAALIAVPGLLVDTQLARNFPSTPQTLDTFLERVRAVTPATASLVVAGTPSTLAVFRSNYLLFPRRIYSALSTSTDAVNGRINWQQIRREARIDHARYVLFWNLAGTLQDRVLISYGQGTLVELRQ